MLTFGCSCFLSAEKREREVCCMGKQGLPLSMQTIGVPTDILYFERRLLRCGLIAVKTDVS